MKYGLIGRTLAHSYSKEIHEALGKYSYGLFSLEPEDLTDFISARDFSGLNVTIPYKKDVIPLCDEIGIDWSTDTYDKGYHLNVWGAEKLTSYFGRILSEKHGMPDRRGEAETKALWDEKLRQYLAERDGTN